METIYERLSLFEKLIQCGQTVYFWSFTPERQVVHTSCPLNLSDIQVFFMNEELKNLNYSSVSFHKPIIYANEFNILWLADFEYDHDTIRYAHVLGPMLTGKESSQGALQRLYDYPVPVAKKAKISEFIESLPIIPSNLLYQYAFMLHYCITGEYITEADIQYPYLNNAQHETESIDLISDEHRGIWQAEQALLQAFRTGSGDYLKTLANSSNLSSGVKADYKDSLEKEKTNAIVLLTLCSRASMEGGLSPQIAYTMFDDYLQKIENARSITDLSFVGKTFTQEYIQRVNKSKTHGDVSPSVAGCLNYIDLHIKEPLDLATLSSVFGYTEYYFSKKFKQEMHIGINEYIRKCKLEQATLLLKTTRKSVQEINEELSFGTRSYFTECFKKVYGMSPAEYRNQNGHD